jgi:hypothetical protein
LFATIIAIFAIIFVIQVTNHLIDKIEKAKQKRKENLIERINTKFGEINTEGAKEQFMKLGYKENSIIINLVDAVFSVGELPIIKLEISNARLMINVVIRDFDGTPIVVIEDSVWTVYDNDYEYNNDDTAFELVTKGGRNVFFQAYFIDNIIHFTGYLINEDGIGMAIYNNNNEINSSELALNSKEDESKLPNTSDLGIPRIFKYPREKYYGGRL